ncbi:MAG: pseudouridine synthase, partial [Ghiorsea sp.]|nr:pseudouridine synthase [Ghiorsea sp.]
KSDKQAKQDKDAQDAVTHYKRLATVELDEPVGRYNTSRYSLLRLTPKTGRKHQLRRHFKHIFHPIVGDTTHGDGKHNQMFRDKMNCHRLLLAATSLSFEHPVSQERINIAAGLDDVYASVLQRLHWSDKV